MLRRAIFRNLYSFIMIRKDRYCLASYSQMRESLHFLLVPSRKLSVVSNGPDENQDRPELLLEREKEMFAIKRRMMSLYQGGQDFEGALQCANELASKVAECHELGGKKSTIYASCLNNIALMVRLYFDTRFN